MIVGTIRFTLLAGSVLEILLQVHEVHACRSAVHLVMFISLDVGFTFPSIGQSPS